MTQDEALEAASKMQGLDFTLFTQHVLVAVADDMAAHTERLLGPDRGSPV